jgi:hypothetical protein
MSGALIEQRMGRYDTRANRILHDACARLPDAERQRPAFFKSIHGTLMQTPVPSPSWDLHRADHLIPSCIQRDANAVRYVLTPALARSPSPPGEEGGWGVRTTSESSLEYRHFVAV